MKRILVVLDSCRLDSYQRANMAQVTKVLGKATPSHTDSNHTITAFLDFLCVNKLPHPVNNYTNPWFKKDFNFIENVKAPIYFLSDNPHLHPVNLHVKGLVKLGVFSKYEVFEPYYRSCDKIVSHADALSLGKDYFVILWFGETHQPFSYGKNVNKKWKAFASRVDKYNRGADNITDSEMKYMHNRQVQACEYIMGRVWPFLNKHRDATIIITSDHGESFGENHRFGHGCDIHEAQFKVPFVTNKR